MFTTSAMQLSTVLSYFLSLCDFPETHMIIATYPSALDQLCSILLSFDTRPFHFLIAATTLFRLASSQDTHPILLSRKIVHKVLDASDVAVASSDDQFYMISR